MLDLALRLLNTRAAGNSRFSRWLEVAADAPFARVTRSNFSRRIPEARPTEFSGAQPLITKTVLSVDVPF